MLDLVSVLYAESLMVLRPWDLWVQTSTTEKKYGDPYENTLTIKSVLSKVLEQSPLHPMARHLYIHLNELSSTPEVALCSNFGKKLWDITPELGHLCHMPSHIEILCGKYQEARISNQVAI